MREAKRKAVVLLSGGLDSSTALYWAKNRGWQVSALSIFYGQRHKRELKAAKALARQARVPHREIKLHLPWLDTSSLANKKKTLPDIPESRIGHGTIPSTYVPGRNTVFLSLAASLADSIGARAIVIGANVLDYSGYPDCRPNYLKAYGLAIKLGTRSGVEGSGIKIIAPLLRLNKKEIVHLALKLKVPLELTWSCYAGEKTPCRRCDSCKLRAKGFLAAGVLDPA